MTFEDFRITNICHTQQAGRRRVWAEDLFKMDMIKQTSRSANWSLLAKLGSIQKRVIFTFKPTKKASLCFKPTTQLHSSHFWNYYLLYRIGYKMWNFFITEWDLVFDVFYFFKHISLWLKYVLHLLKSIHSSKTVFTPVKPVFTLVKTDFTTVKKVKYLFEM